MNVGRTLRRTVRPIWVAGLAATAWVNRRQLRSALGFGKPAGSGHAESALVPAVGDTVTVRTTTTTWADPRRRFHRRTTVPGNAGTTVPESPVATDAALLADRTLLTDEPSLTDKEV
jgi:hypothetical protein